MAYTNVDSFQLDTIGLDEKQAFESAFFKEKKKEIIIFPKHNVYPFLFIAYTSHSKNFTALLFEKISE